MKKADQYFRNTLRLIETSGEWDKNPRPKWGDKSPAFSKFVSQQTFTYHIIDGEFPIQSFRPTAIKGGFYDIEAIYQKQTNIIEEMNPLIWSWWEYFAHESVHDGKGNFSRSIGKTYGHTVKRYDLMNKLLKGMSKDPFGRRHIINLWQEQQRIEDPHALVPCAYETLYTIKEDRLGVRYVDMTLNQRSQDYLMTASINPLQYTQFGQMICGHLQHDTNVPHILTTFKHNVQNVHIYDRHLFAIEELLNRKPSDDNFSMELPEVKNFYDYKFEDFKIVNPYNCKPLSKKLELAV